MEVINPLVSVVIPCFNHGQYLNECLDSIYSSSSIDKIEVILVNDGSTDQYTIDKISSLQYPGLIIIHQINKGLSEARNTGINSAKGGLILNLDCDNKITNFFIEEALKVFNSNPDISIVYSDKIIFYDGSNKKEIIKVEKFYLHTLLIYNYIDSCAIFKKDIWTLVGGFDKNISSFQDWDFWLSCLENGAKFYHIPKPLFYYRIAKNSMLANTNNEKHVQENAYILKKHNVLFSQNWQKVGDSVRYIIRNPFKHFLRMLFKKPLILNLEGR